MLLKKHFFVTNSLCKVNMSQSSGVNFPSCYSWMLVPASYRRNSREEGLLRSASQPVKRRGGASSCGRKPGSWHVRTAPGVVQTRRKRQASRSTREGKGASLARTSARGTSDALESGELPTFLGEECWSWVGPKALALIGVSPLRLVSL